MQGKLRLLLLCGLLFSIPVYSGELQFIANGLTYHFDRETTRNENNWGAGFQYQFGRDRKYQPFVTASTFKDSYKNTSNYVGGGYQRRFNLNQISVSSHADVGLMAFVMTRKDYRDGKPFLGALPFVSVGNEHFAVNFAYVPEFSFNESSLLFVQFMFNLND